MRNAKSDHPTPGGSLLERAAATYDWGRQLRTAPPVVAQPEPPLPAYEPHFAPVEHFDEPAPITPGEIAPIDRLMLAEAGMIVPGAPVGPLAEEFRLVKRQLLITRERIASSLARPPALRIT